MEKAEGSGVGRVQGPNNIEFSLSSHVNLGQSYVYVYNHVVECTRDFYLFAFNPFLTPVFLLLLRGCLFHSDIPWKGTLLY